MAEYFYRRITNFELIRENLDECASIDLGFSN